MPPVGSAFDRRQEAQIRKEMTVDRIKEGDWVQVFWENVEPEYPVEVLYMPVATGDSWHLRREDGTLVYVNSFSKMVKVESPVEPPPF